MHQQVGAASVKEADAADAANNKPGYCSGTQTQKIWIQCTASGKEEQHATTAAAAWQAHQQQQLWHAERGWDSMYY
jgi:hypothetical protein